MKTSLALVLFASFLITMLSLEIPSEDSFKTLLVSYNPTPFKLEGTSKAAYFTFDNTISANGDIAIYFAKGNGFTVEVLFFEKYADITLNAEKTEYLGYKKNIVLNNEKEFVFPKEEVSSTKYYIIIRDRNDYFYSDYITIFNENDVATLESNTPFQIKKFYSGKLYSFEFSGKAGEEINLNVVNSDARYTQSIKVKTEDGTEVISETTESSFSKSISCTSDTKYIMEFKSTYTPAEGEVEKKNIIIYKSNSKLTYLKENTINSVSLINNQKLNFVKDITDYIDNEESVVTYFIDYTMKDMINIKCAVLPIENKEEEIIKYLPKTLSSDCLIEPAGDSDTYSHLYFRKPQGIVDPKKLFLLIVADVNTSNTFIIPKKFNIALSKRTETIDISTLKEGENRFSLTLENYVPYIYKITIPTSFSSNYLIFNEAFRITQFIKGNLINGDTIKSINTVRKDRRLFAFNKDATYKTLIIKIFGSVQQSNLHIVKLEQPLTLLSDFDDTKRPDNIFSFDMVNCKNSAYIVGNYESVSSSIMFQETFYGQFQVYYKKAIDVALGLSESVLPNVNDTKLADITTLDTELDLIYVKCTSPGRMDLHLFDSTTPNEFTENGRTDLYITEGNDVEITMPKTVLGKKMYVEAMSPFKVEKIAVTVDGTEHLLTETSPFSAFEVTMPSTATEEVKALISTEKNTILRIRLSTESTEKVFKQITADESSVSSQYAFIKLDTSSEYTQLDVILQGIKNNFYYEITRLTTVDPNYINLPQYSGAKDNLVDVTKVGNTKTFSFTNPKGKYQTKENYYLIIQLVDGNLNAITSYNIKYEYKNKIPTEKYEKIEPSSLAALTPKKTLELNTNQEEDIVYFAAKCGKTPKSINVNYYSDNLDEIVLNNRYSTGILKNTYLPTQITPVYTEEAEDKSGILFSFVTKAASTAFYPDAITQFNSDISLTVAYDKGIFSWKQINQAEEYYIYILNKTSSEDLTNICYLNSAKPNGTTKDTSYNFTTPGNYSVNVIAKVKNTVSFNVIYQGMEEVKIEGSTNPPKDYTWLWITLSIIVVLLLIAAVFICMRKRKLSHVQLPNSDQPLVGNGSDQIIV